MVGCAEHRLRLLIVEAIMVAYDLVCYSDKRRREVGGLSVCLLRSWFNCRLYSCAVSRRRYCWALSHSEHHHRRRRSFVVGWCSYRSSLSPFAYVEYLCGCVSQERSRNSMCVCVLGGYDRRSVGDCPKGFCVMSRPHRAVLERIRVFLLQAEITGRSLGVVFSQARGKVVQDLDDEERGARQNS